MNSPAELTVVRFEAVTEQYSNNCEAFVRRRMGSLAYDAALEQEEMARSLYEVLTTEDEDVDVFLMSRQFLLSVTPNSQPYNW